MKKKILSVILALVMIAGMIPLGTMTALAGDSITYIGADGQSLTCDATAITDSSTNWSGWMYVSASTTISSSVTLSADTALILGDGATLTVSGGISGSGGTLTVYGQTAGTGTLTVNGANGASGSVGGSGISADVTIYGGNLTATGGTGGNVNDGYGGVGGSGISGAVTIHGGNLTATGGNGGSGGGGNGGSGGSGISADVTIHGGNLTATGGNGDGGGEGGGTGGRGISGAVTIHGGTLTATGGTGAANRYSDGYGGAGIDAESGAVTIYGGTLTATGGNSDDGTYGVGGNGISAAVTIYGGNLTAIGGVGGNGSVGGNGISAVVTIYGGALTAIGGNGGGTYGNGGKGISAAVTIHGGTLTAIGGVGGEDGCPGAALSSAPTRSGSFAVMVGNEAPGSAWDGSSALTGYTYVNIAHTHSFAANSLFVWSGDGEGSITVNYNLACSCGDTKTGDIKLEDTGDARLEKLTNTNVYKASVTIGTATYYCYKEIKDSYTVTFNNVVQPSVGYGGTVELKASNDGQCYDFFEVVGPEEKLIASNATGIELTVTSDRTITAKAHSGDESANVWITNPVKSNDPAEITQSGNAIAEQRKVTVHWALPEGSKFKEAGIYYDYGTDSITKDDLIAKGKKVCVTTKQDGLVKTTEADLNGSYTLTSQRTKTDDSKIMFAIGYVCYNDGENDRTDYTDVVPRLVS